MRARGVLAIVVPAVGLAVALVGAAPAAPAFAQQNHGGSITLGGSISGAVGGAVSGISSPSHASGGVQSTHSEMALGEQEGLAVADSSGGNHNESLNDRYLAACQEQAEASPIGPLRMVAANLRGLFAGQDVRGRVRKP